jgi:hypothetical protein
MVVFHVKQIKDEMCEPMASNLNARKNTRNEDRTRDLVRVRHAW